MTVTARYWTCRRHRDGKVCLYKNPAGKQLCERCGGRKPKRKRPKHMAALQAPYETYIALTGGEFCAICLRPRGTKRLHRDHCHRSGKPRALLCFRCNTRLDARITPEWLRAAADYLERTAA